MRETIAGDGINGPRDMTARTFGDQTELFVTNVLNGTVAGAGALFGLAVDLDGDAVYFVDDATNQLDVLH